MAEGKETSSPRHGLDIILAAKGERWAKKLSLAKTLESGDPTKPTAIAVLTLRMPAPLRTSGRFTEAALSMHLSFAQELRRREIRLLYEEFNVGGDGPESYLAAAFNPVALKHLSIAWEATHPWGELADLDIMDSMGNPLSRADLGYPPRACLVCGGEAALCVRERRHELKAVEARIGDLLGKPETGESAEDRRMGGLALAAALAEVSAQPKPGLVGPLSRGAHSDMGYSTFLSSAATIGPWFVESAQLGRIHRGEISELLPELRRAGKEAERAMFAATGGVNTHKGLIFSMGLLCAAAGRLLAEGAVLNPESCAACAASIVQGISVDDFRRLEGRANSTTMTKGERLHSQYGFRGIRGEAEDGFPSVLRTALPMLRAGLSAGLSRNDAMIDSLLALFSIVDDTNVLGRSGSEGLAFLRAEAKRALALGGMAAEDGQKAVQALDIALVERNISPGGCADLLALTVFLDLLAPAGMSCI